MLSAEKYCGKEGFSQHFLGVLVNGLQWICHLLASFWNFPIDK